MAFNRPSKTYAIVFHCLLIEFALFTYGILPSQIAEDISAIPVGASFEVFATLNAPSYCTEYVDRFFWTVPGVAEPVAFPSPVTFEQCLETCRQVGCTFFTVEVSQPGYCEYWMKSKQPSELVAATDGLIGTYVTYQCDFPTPAPSFPPTFSPTTRSPTTRAPTTRSPTTQAPTTRSPTTQAPTTRSPTTQTPTTRSPTTEPPTTESPTVQVPSGGTPTQPPSNTGKTEEPTVMPTISVDTESREQNSGDLSMPILFAAVGSVLMLTFVTIFMVLVFRRKRKQWKRRNYENPDGHSSNVGSQGPNRSSKASPIVPSRGSGFNRSHHSREMLNEFPPSPPPGLNPRPYSDASSAPQLFGPSGMNYSPRGTYPPTSSPPGLGAPSYHSSGNVVYDSSPRFFPPSTYVAPHSAYVVPPPNHFPHWSANSQQKHSLDPEDLENKLARNYGRNSFGSSNSDEIDW